MTTTTTTTDLVPSFANARRPQPSHTPRGLQRVHLISDREPTAAERRAYTETHFVHEAEIRESISAGLEHATEWMLPAVVLPRLPFLITQPMSSYSFQDTAFAARCWTPDCL